MRTVLLASLRTHTRRYVAATVAVVIGVAFVVVTNALVLGHPQRPAVAGIDQPYRGADVVVSDVTGEDAARLVDSAAERGDHAAPLGWTIQPVREGDRLVDERADVGALAPDPDAALARPARGPVPRAARTRRSPT